MIELQPYLWSPLELISTENIYTMILERTIFLKIQRDTFMIQYIKM